MFFDDSTTIDEEIDETEQTIDMWIEQVELPTEINADAIAVAINFVEVCCQRTLYTTGRQLVADKYRPHRRYNDVCSLSK